MYMECVLLAFYLTNRRVGVAVLEHRRVVGAIRCNTVLAKFGCDDANDLTGFGAVVAFARVRDDRSEYWGYTHGWLGARYQPLTDTY